MSRTWIELRCSRELALLLGAIAPQTLREHRQMRDAGHLRVRDGRCMVSPLFWPWAVNRAEEMTEGPDEAPKAP